jgi:hypothetical protein
MKNNRITALILLSAILLVTFHVGSIGFTGNTVVTGPEEAPSYRALSGFDSPNITVVLLTPANQSEVAGTFNITLDITSLNGDLNLTLFVADEVYPAYNRTIVGTGVQNVTVDTLQLAEGNLNFTLLFENETFTPVDRESYYLVFEVNNHGVPVLELLSPMDDDIFTGLANLTVNITSTYSEVYLNVTVEITEGVWEITPEYNRTLVPVGLSNFTINGSRYENGGHTINVTVITEEGFTDTASVDLNFLDYVRIRITDKTNFDTISGDQEIGVRIESPFDNVTLSVFVDNVLAPDVSNITIPEGISSFNLDTTPYSEGEHNVTFKAFDAFGHFWEIKLILVVDNFGIPSVSFVGPRDDVVVGLTSFTINIESEWDTVNLTVYVDDEEVAGFVNLRVSPGEYTFQLDVGQFTKWQHDLKVVVTTDENLEAEATETYGFASFKIEEILSGVVLLGVAIMIPLYRKRKGQPIKPVLIVDLLFFIAVLALFATLGVTTVTLAIWHINLGSIWAIGSALVFMNWVFPLVYESGTE